MKQRDSWGRVRWSTTGFERRQQKPGLNYIWVSTSHQPVSCLIVVHSSTFYKSKGFARYDQFLRRPGFLNCSSSDGVAYLNSRSKCVSRDVVVIHYYPQRGVYRSYRVTCAKIASNLIHRKIYECNMYIVPQQTHEQHRGSPVPLPVRS